MRSSTRPSTQKKSSLLSLKLGASTPTPASSTTATALVPLLLVGTSSSSYLVDPVSSDPSEPSPPPEQPTFRTNLSKTLLSHLKPLSLPTPSLPLAIPSSDKENTSSTPASGSSGVRRRRVNFSSTPLASLNASPHHNRRVHPYAHAKRGRVMGLYSSGSSSWSGSSDWDEEGEGGVESPPTSVGSPVALRRRDACGPEVGGMLGGAMDVDSDDDDDEEEGYKVELLLLSQEQLLTSPLRPSPFSTKNLVKSFTLSLPPPRPVVPVSRNPRSILKRNVHPILKVPSALEGCRVNGGRKKHSMGFWDVDLPIQFTTPALVQLEIVKDVVMSWVEGETSPFSAVELAGRISRAAAGEDMTIGRGKGLGRSDAGEGKGKGKASTEGSGADSGSVQGGGTGDDDGSEPPPPPSSTPDPATLTTPKLDDPVHLLSPLITLKASLRVVTAGEIRQHQARTSAFDNGLGEILPRQITTSTTTDRASPLSDSIRRSPLPPPVTLVTSSPDSRDDGELASVPTTLHEVEAAYFALIRALVHVPSVLADESRTLAPLREHKATLIKCMTRDILNVGIFPSTSRPLGFSHLGRDLGVYSSGSSSSGSMGGVGSSSSPLRDAGVKEKKGLSDSEMRRQKDEVAVAQVAIKCLVYLCQYERFFSIFGPSELHPVLTAMFALPSIPNLSTSVHKDVYPFISWFLSQQRLPPSFLHAYMPAILTVIRITIKTSDKPRHNLSEAIAAVGRLLQTHPDAILGQWESWFGPTFEGLYDMPKKGMAVRIKAVTTLGKMVQVLRIGVDRDEERSGAVRDAIGDALSNLLYGKRGVTTKEPNHTALMVLSTQLEACLKTDEAPWAVNVLALLPLLLGKRFRRIEPAGVRPWVGLVSTCRLHTSLSLRTLNNLQWNHLVYAFLMTSPGHGSNAPASMWIFRDGPFNVLIGTLSQRSVWREKEKDSSKDRAKILALTLVGMVFGLSIVNQVILAGAVQAEVARDQMVHYDLIWEKLLAGSTVPVKEAKRLKKVEESVDVDPAPPVPKTRFVQGDLVNVIQCSRADAAAIGWETLTAIVTLPLPSTPLPSLERLLNTTFLDGQLSKTKKPDALAALCAKAVAKVPAATEIPGWGAEWVMRSSQKVLDMVEMCLLAGERRFMEDTLHSVGLFWNAFLATLMSSEETVETNLALQSVVAWVVRVPTLYTARRSDKGRLALCLIDIALRVIGQRLVRLPSIDTLELPFTSLAVSFLTRSSGIDAPLETSIATQLLNFTPLSSEVLVRCTTTLLSLESPIDDAVITELSGHWSKTLLGSSVDASEYGLFKAFLEDKSEVAQPAGMSQLVEQVVLHLVSSLSEVPLVVTLIHDILLRAQTPLFLAIYPKLLEALPCVIQPIAPDLSLVVPLLAPFLTRTLDLHDDRSPTAQLCTDILTAFHGFWCKTFETATEYLDIPEDLANILSVIRKFSNDLSVEQLAMETQVATTGEGEKTTSDLSESAPAPAQAYRSLVIEDSMTEISHSRLVDETGRAYEGDVSHAVDSSTDSAVPAEPLCSPSLGLPNPAANRSSSPIASPELSYIEETPESIRNARSRAPRTSSAMTKSLPRDASPPAAVKDEASSLEIVPATVSRPATPVVSMDVDDDDDDSDAVITSRMGPSQSSQIARDQALRAKKSRASSSKSSTSSSRRPSVEARRKTKTRSSSVDAKGVAVDDSASSSSQTRSKRRKIEEVVDDSLSQPSISDEEAIRRLTSDSFASPDSTIRATYKIAGSPGLLKFMDLGERAREYFERITGRGGGTDR